MSFMDENLVYSKTSAGEEAVRQRTRVVQRNLRMVLILVDGKTTAGELSAKVGNPQLVEQSLRELEEDGFIAPADEAASKWARSFANLYQSAKPGTPERPVQNPSTLTVPEVSYFHGPSSRPGMVDEVEEEEGEQRQATAAPPEAALAAPPAGPGLFSRLGATFHSRKIGRSSKKGPNKLLFGLVAVVLLVIGLYASLPQQRYRHELEAGLTAALGSPVSVERLGFGWAGQPALLAKVSKVGDGTISLGEVALVPRWGSLWSERPGWRRIEVNGAQLPLAAVAGLPTVAERLGASGEPARVVLRDALLTLGPLAVAGRWRADSAGGESVQLDSDDGTLHAIVSRRADGVAVSWRGLGWNPSGGSRWAVDQVEGEALVEPTTSDAVTVQLRKVEALALDGRWQGEARLEVRGGRIALEGRAALKFVAGNRLASLGLVPVKIQGPCSAELAVRAQGKDWDALLAGMAFEGPVTVGKGELTGIDLLQSVREGGASLTRGGVTSFDNLTGRIRRDGRGTALTGLTLQSGLIGASGRVAADGNGRLDGLFDVQLRGSANQLRAQLVLTGTAADPQLRRLR